MTVTAGTVLTLVEATVVGIGTPPLLPMVVSAILGAPSGIVMALVPAIIADNKVEAFAAPNTVSAIGLLPGRSLLPSGPLAARGQRMPGVVASGVWTALLARRVQDVVMR